MSTIKDTATVDLFVNGEQASQTIDRLKKQTESLSSAIKEAQDAGELKKAKKLQNELDKITRVLNRTESASKGVGVVMNNLSNSSIHGLKNALKYLQKELNLTRPGTEKWKQYASQIQEVKNRISELHEELQEKKGIWDRFRKWAEDTWPALDLLNGWYNKLISSMRSYVDAYASMDQEMANVRKFTGMTEKDVAQLNEEFKKIDTRSSREELNKLAQEAGRLGKTSVEDVLGFVRAADRINVALDDLGSGATLTLSKLTGIFGVEAVYGTEQSLLKVGSVINELSQNCSASAPYLSNFTERLGGVGAQAGLTIQQIMGFGAVLDSNAQKVEASATALSQVIVRLYQDPAKYAKVAGLEVESFSKLMREDANAALILFLETLEKAGGMDTLSPMFKDMGENGSRAIAALSTLATHIKQVKRQQEAANIAFDEGTSIDKEFAVQNNTVAAALEKCRNRANELRVELGEHIQPLMRHLLVSSSAMIKALLSMIQFGKENATTIGTLVVATTTYIAVCKLQALWLDRAAIKTMLLNKSSVALAASQKLLSGIGAVLQVGIVSLTNTIAYFRNGLTVTYAMQERWRKSMEAMKFSTWAGLILAVASAVYLLSKRMTSLTAVQKSMAEAERQANAEIADTVTKIKSLQSIIEDEKRSLWERHQAITALRSIMDDYNGSLDKEGRLIEHNTGLIDAYIKKLRERALAAALEEQMKQAYQDLVTYGRKIFGKNTNVENSAEAKVMSDLLMGRVSENMALVPNSALTVVPKGYENGIGSTGQESGLLDKLFGHETDVSKFNDALKVFLALSKQVDSNNIHALVTKDSGPKVNEDRYSTDEAYKKAVDELKSTLEAAITAAGDDQEKKDNATFQYQLGLQELNSKQGGKPDGGLCPHGNPPHSCTICNPSEPDILTVDRFAEEKTWREREEAEARIAYAKGETSFTEHTARMAEIAADYYEKLRERTDLSAVERLKIEADYQEAAKKESDAGTKVQIDTENLRYQETIDNLRKFYYNRISQDNVSTEDRERALKVFNESMEMAEMQHLQRLIALYQDGSEEQLSAQRTLHEKEIAAQERHLKEMEDLQKSYASIKDKVFGMNQAEKDAEFDKQFAALQTVYQMELRAVGDNEAEKLRIKEAYMAAELALRKEYDQEGAESTESGYKDAIAKSAEWLKGEGGQALKGALSSITSGMSAIFSGLSTMIQAELDIQTAAIEKRYDKELSAAQGNSYKVAQLEKKKEHEIAKLKNDANRKMFAMQVIQAIAQTATNALNAYGSAAAVPVIGHILAPIAAAMAIAAGGIQIAAIKKQQQASAVQGYSKGGFTKPGPVDEPAGIVHAGEWVASQKLLSNPVARPMIEALDYAQRTNTIGSLRAEDVSRSIRATDSIVRMSESDNTTALMLSVIAGMSRSVDNLNTRLNEPFVTVNTVTGDKGIKQAQDEYSRLISNKSPKSRK